MLMFSNNYVLSLSRSGVSFQLTVVTEMLFKSYLILEEEDKVLCQKTTLDSD